MWESHLTSFPSLTISSASRLIRPPFLLAAEIMHPPRAGMLVRTAYHHHEDEVQNSVSGQVGDER